MNHITRRTWLHASVWVAAILVGFAAVFYANIISFVQHHYFIWFQANSLLVAALSPLAFVLATYLVVQFAPEAKGSGIPQVLEAIESGKATTHRAQEDAELWDTPSVSIKTAGIKVLSSLVGILGGASIGREGPTVQIAASAFTWVGRKLHKKVPQINFRAFLVAGAGAGVAAAFNTPLAGITFAIEEIADGAFGPFRRTVMLAVIVSGIVAQAILGDYLYFGHIAFGKNTLLVIPQALLIGIVGGIFGGGFAKILAYPQLARLPQHWKARALVCGILCSIIGYYTHGDTAGSGYEVTKKSLEAATLTDASLFFPLLKLSTTILSYLSGMAGGIFSPSLSIGAGLGISIAKIAHFTNFQTCALMGMVAFFSGVVQAPLTAVIIVMEMTDEHILILPFMISAFLAHGVGKGIMPTPLYSFLAGRREDEHHDALHIPEAEVEKKKLYARN